MAHGDSLAQTIEATQRSLEERLREALLRTVTRTGRVTTTRPPTRSWRRPAGTWPRSTPSCCSRVRTHVPNGR